MSLPIINSKESKRIHPRLDLSIIGKKFGKLTVLEFVFYKKNHSYWKVRCECGTEKISERSSFIHGGNKTCGKGKCTFKSLKGEKNPNFVNLQGKKFGRLVVKKINHFNIGAMWDCLCQCGKKTIVRGTSLISGQTQSCGCLAREITSKLRLIDLIGKRFGSYIVIKRIKNKKRKNRE